MPLGICCRLHVDPIEKKPFTHFLPGSQALTFGMLGCNFRCDFCQNWQTSQHCATRVREADRLAYRKDERQKMWCSLPSSRPEVIASSYNEPLITSEWAVEIFKLRESSRDSRPCLSPTGMPPGRPGIPAPWLDGIKVDLKCMKDKSYRELGGMLQPVLDSIQTAARPGIVGRGGHAGHPRFQRFSTQEFWDAAASSRLGFTRISPGM